ncbi:MAG: hypothetical protein PHN82_02050 [bacterium]|nr:hypothetical protein [bacterium]
METNPAVGGRVRHPCHGDGEVLGVDERRGVVRIRFPGAGVKELPYPFRDGGVPPGAAGGAVLVMGFAGRPPCGPGCRWRLLLGTAPLAPLVRDIGRWASGKARLEGADVSLKAVGRGEMELLIAGRGRDGRCRWCRTFRSGLKTAMGRTYGREALRVERSCDFETPRPGG